MNYIGIDLGGTNIKGALVSAKGEILKEHSIPTRVDLGPEAVAGRIGQVIVTATAHFIPDAENPQGDEAGDERIQNGPARDFHEKNPCHDGSRRPYVSPQMHAISLQGF